MTDVVVGVALGLCAAALLPAGIAHLARPATFAQLLAAHGIVPARSAGLVAIATALTEVAIGVAAIAVVVTGTPGWPVLAAALVLGISFVAYVSTLLRRPDTGMECGCTPLSAPVTAASLLPGATVAIGSALALLGNALAPAEPALLGTAWGATLALAVMLVPASAPRPVEHEAA